MKNSGRTAKSTVYGSVAVVVNIVFNAVFIFGLAGFPAMGIAGAALATTVSRALEFLLTAYENTKRSLVCIRMRYIRHSSGKLKQAREYGNRLFRLAVFTGAVSGLILLAVSPVLNIFTGSLSVQAHSYLKNMMYICTYYMVGKSVNATVIAGIFCAGGDTKFGLKCDAVTMWVVLIPAGMLAAFVFKLPVMAVYFIISMDEVIKVPAVYAHYKKYRWVRNLTENEKPYDPCSKAEVV